MIFFVSGFYKMGVKFLDFETPEQEEAQLENDLAIINEDEPSEPVVEDLKGSPFVKEPKRVKKEAFKPPPPKPCEDTPHPELEIIEPEPEPAKKVKQIKPKRPLSEKQKAHLENMRLKRAEKQKAKIEKQMAKTDIVSKVEKKMEKPVEYTEEEIKEMEKEEFNNWIKHMDKFNKMMEAVEREKKRKMMEQQKKEAEIEARIRKKIEMEQKQRSGVRLPAHNPQPPKILNQPQNEYGEFSHMFGY
jgi:hypothetical protein